MPTPEEEAIFAEQFALVAGEHDALFATLHAGLHEAVFDIPVGAERGAGFADRLLTLTGVVLIGLTLLAGCSLITEFDRDALDPRDADGDADRHRDAREQVLPPSGDRAAAQEVDAEKVLQLRVELAEDGGRVAGCPLTATERPRVDTVTVHGSRARAVPQPRL